MSDKPVIHPEKDELVAFGLGKLEPDDATKIETHLGECDACCETLLDLKDDTFVELVRKSPEPKQLMEAAKDNVGSELTEPAEGVATDNSVTAETMLVGSAASLGPTDLPAQLEDHPRYRIIELIGKGGMGDVYKAEHRLMDRLVALKLINQDLVKNTQAVDRFRREVRAAASLTHRNIVTAYDAEQAGDVHFLVMEFVDGTDLSSVVQQQGPLPIAQACDCIRQAADGLQHAHETGMVHRDIKPHNLMLSESGQVRVLDFGLAGFAAESALLEAEPDGDAAHSGSVPLHLTTMGSVMGTPDYIAPEQARDAHSADIRADIYGLGCTLCYLLTGEAPFTADTVVNKLKAHEQQEPPALQGLRDDVPAELADIVTRMMAKNPDDRLQTPAEVATALSPFANAQQTGSVTAQRSKRKRLLAIATALLVPLLLVAGVVIYRATDTGQVEIDASGLDLPRAKIVLLKDGKEYASFNLKADDKPQTIRAGKYEVQLRNAPDNVQMKVLSRPRNSNNWDNLHHHKSDPIILYRGGGMLIEVARLQPRAVANLTDYDRLQGSWVCIDGLIGNKPLSKEWLASTSMKFDHDLVELAGLSSQKFNLKYALGQFREPKWIEFINPDKTSSERAIAGIYAFEGETLRIAFDDADRPRPRDFKPTDEHDHFVGTFRQTTTTPRATPTKSGILTSPPSVPPGGLPVGRNLIRDPSLEYTQLGRLPRSWSAWLDDGPDFKCEVVEGGVTGKHCLQISGKGTRGVVFCTSVPMDRTRRYALKGRVKLEGDSTSWAVIKINYFNKSGWLGVDDRVGVSSKQSGWQFFEKTDRADVFPEATLMVPTCHIEGNGTAWFDDLEVIAYDRDTLPADFDAKNGKHNRRNRDQE